MADTVETQNCRVGAKVSIAGRVLLDYDLEREEEGRGKGGAKQGDFIGRGRPGGGTLRHGMLALEKRKDWTPNFISAGESPLPRHWVAD